MKEFVVFNSSDLTTEWNDFKAMTVLHTVFEKTVLHWTILNAGRADMKTKKSSPWATGVSVCCSVVEDLLIPAHP